MSNATRIQHRSLGLSILLAGVMGCAGASPRGINGKAVGSALGGAGGAVFGYQYGQTGVGRSVGSSLGSVAGSLAEGGQDTGARDAARREPALFCPVGGEFYPDGSRYCPLHGAELRRRTTSSP